MTTLKSKDFMKEKNNLIDITMNVNDIKIVYNYPIYRKGSKKHLDKGFVESDNSQMGGSHWTCF